MEKKETYEGTSQPIKLSPIVKWAGGKSQLADYILGKIDFKYKRYYEPFLGGAAILLALCPKNAICSDINDELINFYSVVKDSPEKLISTLENKFSAQNSSEFYYAIRNWDRDVCFKERDKIERAARFVYLNKNCYNGLWRENLRGQNNVPKGNYTSVRMPDFNNIRNVSHYLKSNKIELLCKDYKDSLKNAGERDLIYLDPPYDVEDSQDGFISYSQKKFTRTEQIQLKEICDELIDRGATVLLSNSDTPFINQLFSTPDYQIHRDKEAFRYVGSKRETRRKVVELLIVGKPKK